jgi:predicted small metal-binding protein
VAHHEQEADMKEFSCGAVVPGCTATFQAESEDEILAKVAEHARVDHGMETVPPDVVEQVRQNISTR